MNNKSIFKKISTLFISTAMIVTMLPKLSTPILAQGTTNELPNETQFATLDQLKKFNTNDADGAKNPAKLYFGGNSQQWWIAGSQNGNLTLFAASPFGESLPFEVNTSQNKQYRSDWDCKYPNGNPESVYPNHYGASPLRVGLKGYVEYWFTELEQKLLNTTTIYTTDTKNNNSVYSTTEILYLAYGNETEDYITVGTNSPDSLNNGLRIDKDYFYKDNSGKVVLFWLRSPKMANSSVALIVTPEPIVRSFTVSNSGALVPSFELNLSSVLFASAALAASSDGDLTLQDTNGDGAFTLRHSGKKLGSALVSLDGSKVILTGAPEGTYLVVQNSKGAKAKSIAGSITVTADEMGLDSFVNCKVWLEKTDVGNRITYATLASNQEKYVVNITAGEGLTITSTNGLQEIAQGSNIVDINVGVKDGYTLPEMFINEVDTLIEASGLYTKVGDTDNTFVIKGTPNSNVTITLPAATLLPKVDTPSVNETPVTTPSFDDGGPFTTNAEGDVFDRWGNLIYDAPTLTYNNNSEYNFVNTSDK